MNCEIIINRNEVYIITEEADELNERLRYPVQAVTPDAMQYARNMTEIFKERGHDFETWQFLRDSYIVGIANRLEVSVRNISNAFCALGF